jgi:hypothetical protein
VVNSPANRQFTGQSPANHRPITGQLLSLVNEDVVGTAT